MHPVTLNRRRPCALAPAAVLLLALCLLAGGVQALTDSPALVISEPGRYTLDQDLASNASIGVLINSSDVVLDGMGHGITGTGANGSMGVNATGPSFTPITNVTIRNLSVRNWSDGIRVGMVSGLVVEDVVAEQNGVGLILNPNSGITTGSTIRDSVFRENAGSGIELRYPAEGIVVERCSSTGNFRGLATVDSGRFDASANRIADCDFSVNTDHGLFIDGGHFSEIDNCTIRGNGGDGLRIAVSRTNITGNLVENNGGTGVNAGDRSSSTITGNRITGNNLGVATDTEFGFRVWNNLLNNTREDGISNLGGVGFLNTTTTAGPNIVGGPFIGGNFWASPNGTGFSQTHPDTDGDGFCDEPYVLGESTTDYLPLALPNIPPVGGDRGFFLVSTVPSGAAISLVDISGTAYPQGTTSAGPLNVTIMLTATPMKQIVANLPGYRDAVFTITQYPARGQTVPVSLTLDPISRPFKPLAIPGTIHAEDYDLGGEGAAYHDTTPGNTGGAYRADDVDIETAGSVTNVGWIRNGEFLVYTATVAAPGQYTMTARVASPNSGRTIAVSVDGTPLATIGVPNTGSFGIFRSVSVPVTLAAGQHTLRLAFAGDGQNLDWVEFAPVGENGRPFKPLAIPGTIQAEDYNLGGEGVAYHDTTPANEGGAYRTEGVDIERGGSNYDVGWIRNGEWLTYTATVQSAGTFTMTARVASPNSGRSFTLLIDGVPAATVAVPNTGSFATFRTVLVPVALPAGPHTLRLAFTGDGQNLDSLSFSSAVVTTPPTTPPSGGANFVAVPTTAPHGTAVKFTTTPASGKTIASARWSFDAPAHLNTWNSRNVNPTFYYFIPGTFSPRVDLTYTDGSTETVHRVGYIRAT